MTTEIKDRILRLNEVKARAGIGRTSIYMWMKEGNFPQSVHLGGRAIGWVESEIDEWIKTRARCK